MLISVQSGESAATCAIQSCASILPCTGIQLQELGATVEEAMHVDDRRTDHAVVVVVAGPFRDAVVEEDTAEFTRPIDGAVLVLLFQSAGSFQSYTTVAA